MTGTFYGIGVGPGDPELLTIKAVRAIEKVDIIIAPKTEKKEGSVALDIAKPYLKKDVRIVYQVTQFSTTGWSGFTTISSSSLHEVSVVMPLNVRMATAAITKYFFISFTYVC